MVPGDRQSDRRGAAPSRPAPEEPGLLVREAGWSAAGPTDLRF